MLQYRDIMNYLVDKTLAYFHIAELPVFDSRPRKIVSTPQSTDRLWGHRIQWVPVAVSFGVKRPRRRADYSPPSSAESKSGGTIPSLPVQLYEVELD